MCICCVHWLRKTPESFSTLCTTSHQTESPCNMVIFQRHPLSVCFLTIFYIMYPPQRMMHRSPQEALGRPAHFPAFVLPDCLSCGWPECWHTEQASVLKHNTAVSSPQKMVLVVVVVVSALSISVSSLLLYTTVNIIIDPALSEQFGNIWWNPSNYTIPTFKLITLGH